MKQTKRCGWVWYDGEVREADQLMVVTTGGKLIRTRVAGISVLGRATQGVRLIRRPEGETVSSVARIDDSQTGGEEAEPIEPDLDEVDDEADEGDDEELEDEGEPGEGEEE